MKQRPKSLGKPRISTQEALSKILRYCAYQERCHKEVKNKLFDYNLAAQEVDEVIAYLITEGFLNEERFARTFAGGKFRILKWGKLKIQRELETAGLTSRCIARGLSEIEDEDYRKSLHQLVKKKASSTVDRNPFTKKNKVARFAIGRGFEPELVWEAVNDVVG